MTEPCNISLQTFVESLQKTDFADKNLATAVTSFLDSLSGVRVEGLGVRDDRASACLAGGEASCITPGCPEGTTWGVGPKAESRTPAGFLRRKQTEEPSELKNSTDNLITSELKTGVGGTTANALNHWVHCMLDRHLSPKYIRRNLQALNAAHRQLFGTFDKQTISPLVAALESPRHPLFRAHDAAVRLRQLASLLDQPTPIERSPYSKERSDFYGEAQPPYSSAMGKPANQSTPSPYSCCSASVRTHLSVMLTSLILPELGAAEIARLKVTDDLPEVHQLHDIVAQCLQPKRKYIFDLGQTTTRIETIVKNLCKPKDKELAAMFGDLGDMLADPAFRTDVWLQAARLGGVSDTVLRGILGDNIPDTYCYLRDVPLQPVEQHPRLLARRAVATYLIPDYRRWYAMGLRARITPDNINNRLQDLGIGLETFYPLDEKRVGKNLKKKLLPYISRVLFFKSKPQQLNYLFNQIGDLSWPYRVTKEPGSPYAIINDMANFKRAIQAIDPHTDIDILDVKDIAAGERVLITGGPWSGYEGTVLKTATPDHYQLVITLCDVSFDTTVTLEPQYLERVTG